MSSSHAHAVRQGGVPTWIGLAVRSCLVVLLSNNLAKAGNEPLAVRMLSNTETLRLIESRPVWCMDRSDDGVSCGSVMIASRANEHQVSLVHYFRSDFAGREGIANTKVELEVRPEGLCANGILWLGAQNWSPADANFSLSSFQMDYADTEEMVESPRVWWRPLGFS